MQDSTVTITVTAIDGATKVFQGVGDAAVKNANKAANAWVKANEISDVSIQSTGEAATATNRAAKAQDNLTSSTRRSYFAQTALTTVLSAGINKAFLTMVDVTGQAIQRVDLISQFPQSMEALGLSASDASTSLQKLSAYIGQIGGNLQDATSTVTRFAEVTKNVKAATAEFVGVNNALIAGGARADVQKNALEQLIQAYSRGVPQLIEWRSLQVAMPAQLNAVAKAMGFVNSQGLGEALSNGKVSMQAFVTQLTKMSATQGPILTQAEVKMNGVQFAFNRFKNTMVAGMTEIIQTVGRQNIVDFFNTLANVVVVLAGWTVKLIGLMMTLFNVVSGAFGGTQLKLATDKTGDISDNLGSGASNANDLANGLDDASKAAKKTANSLAAFDKMNVLTENKDSGMSGPAGLSAADASDLNKIFDDMNYKLAGVTGTAKILAGILAGLVGIKFAKNLVDQFNGVIKTVEETGKNIDKLNNKLGKIGKVSDSALKGLFGKGAGGSGAAGEAAAQGVTIGLALRNGIIAGIGVMSAVFDTLLLGPLALVGAVVVEALVALGVLAVGVTLPFWALVGIGVLVVAAIVGIIYLIYKNWNTIIGLMSTAASAFWGFIQTGWKLVVGAIVAVWQTLFDVFAAPFKFILQFTGAVLTLIVAVVATFVQLVVGLWVYMVKGIYNALSAVVGWVYNNVISPIISLFTTMWTGIVDIHTAAVNIIFSVLSTIGSWIYTNIILPVYGFFKGLWDGVSVLVSGFFNSVKITLSPFTSWIYGNIIQPIASLFSGLWDGIKNGLSGMINSLKSIAGELGGLLKEPINAIFNAWNKVADQINKVSVPKWVPGIGGNSVNFPKLTLLAKGGIVDQPTFSMLGEAGKEAVVPLENNTGWIDKLASKINTTTTQSNDTHIPSKLDKQQSSNNITIQVSGVFATSVAEQRKVADIIAKRINESLGQRKLQGA